MLTRPKMISDNRADIGMLVAIYALRDLPPALPADYI
jgi:hypothetical protein